jgi:hypothetical protein
MRSDTENVTISLKFQRGIYIKVRLQTQSKVINYNTIQIEIQSFLLKKN